MQVLNIGQLTSTLRHGVRILKCSVQVVNHFSAGDVMTLPIATDCIIARRYCNTDVLDTVKRHFQTLDHSIHVVSNAVTLCVCTE